MITRIKNSGFSPVRINVRLVDYIFQLSVIPMDRSYKQFLVVAELGNISQAATYLGLSQPTLTSSMKKNWKQALMSRYLSVNLKGSNSRSTDNYCKNKRSNCNAAMIHCYIKWQISKSVKLRKLKWAPVMPGGKFSSNRHCNNTVQVTLLSLFNWNLVIT